MIREQDLYIKYIPTVCALVSAIALPLGHYEIKEKKENLKIAYLEKPHMAGYLRGEPTIKPTTSPGAQIVQTPEWNTYRNTISEYDSANYHLERENTTLNIGIYGAIAGGTALICGLAIACGRNSRRQRQEKKRKSPRTS